MPQIVIIGSNHIDAISYQEDSGGSLFKRLLRLNSMPTFGLSQVYNVPREFAFMFGEKCTFSDCTVDLIEVESNQSNEDHQNVEEAEELVEYFSLNNLQQESTVILTPFNGQVDLINDVLKANNQIVPVYTFDKFCGGHAKTVLCSLVSNQLTPFLQRRLASIVTRAEERLVIFHSPNLNLLLSKN